MIIEKESRSYMPKSQSDTHITPDRVYDKIYEVTHWTKEDMFDPCPVNFTVDGLSIPWKEINYVNPPYKLLTEFVAKAIVEGCRGNKTIMLLPSKTDQEWFHELISRDYFMMWFQGRLKFKNDKWSATQPHFLVLVK